MSRFLYRLWRAITFPFRGIWRVVSSPARAVRAVKEYMDAEPEEHPLGDVFADLAQNSQSREMFWEQVEVLRAHLLRAVLGIAVGVAIAFLFTPQLLAFLARPIGGIQNLVAIEVTESIGVYMKVALLGGVAIALPYVAFELWAFAAPGLRPRERWMGLIGIPLAAIFFIGGMAFTYFAMLPSALPFLLNFAGIQARVRPASYFGFVTGLMFWIGVAFEFPLVIYVLTAMGIIKPQPLARNWRIAVVVISIVAAAITPTVDPVNMGLVMLPMILLYFISIGLSYMAYSGRQKPEEKSAAEEGSA